MADAISWYNANAKIVCERYEKQAAEHVHGWLIDLLPAPPAAVLDVGAGTGRDAAWLSTRGFDVIAAEPSSGMRAVAKERHGDRQIRWLADSLPDLAAIFRTGQRFDFILLSAIWMHVAPVDRAQAFGNLIRLVKPGGLVAITLRHGPAEPERRMHTVSSAEVAALAQRNGAQVVRDIAENGPADEVHWTRMAIRRPES